MLCVVAYRICWALLQIVDLNVSFPVNVHKINLASIESVKIRALEFVANILDVRQLIIIQFVVAQLATRVIHSSFVSNKKNVSVFR